MAFGDTGNRRVLVNGIPFRVDGETYEEAQQKVRDMLETEPRLFDLRAKALGLEQNDIEALALASEKGEAALKGTSRAVDAAAGNLRIPYTQGIRVNEGLSKLLIGSGRGIVNRYRGARQALASIFDDEEAAKAVAREDEDERQLYQQLDDAGVGLEDVGEIGTDIAAFLGATALTGGGAVPMFVTGAALGASDVKNEIPVAGSPTDDTVLEGGRGKDALIGGAASLLGPALKAGGAAVGAIAGKMGIGVSKGITPNLWLRTKVLRYWPQALTNIVDDGLQYTKEGMDAGRQIIGRAALDRVQQILSRLPATEAKGLKDAAAFGALRNAVKEATQTTAGGVNVFNPAVFEKNATDLIGQLGNAFTKTEHQLLAASIGKLSKEMQRLPSSIDPALAEKAAAALVGPARESAETVLKALERASKPSVRQMLFESIAEKGVLTIESLQRALPRAVVGGTSENVATEGVEDVEEFIGGRQTSRANSGR